MHGDLERIKYVLTLGTGFGFALFRDGNIAPHLELSQHPIRKHKTYNEYVGEAALECAGGRHWSKRVHKIIAVIEAVITDPVVLEESTKCPDPSPLAALFQPRLNLGERQIGFLFYDAKNEGCLSLDVLRPAIAALHHRCERPARANLRGPADGARCAHPKPRRRLAA